MVTDQVKILSETAHLWAKKMNWTNDPKYADMMYEQLYNIAFARLVAQECIEWVTAHSKENDKSQNIIDDIKVHFDIEAIKY